VPIAPMQRMIYKSFLTAMDQMTVQEILGSDSKVDDDMKSVMDAVKKVHKKHSSQTMYQKMKALMFNLKMCCSQYRYLL
jgi:hypothetical protein